MDIPTQILTNKVLELVSKLVVHSSIIFTVYCGVNNVLERVFEQLQYSVVFACNDYMLYVPLGHSIYRVLQKHSPDMGYGKCKHTTIPHLLLFLYLRADVRFIQLDSAITQFDSYCLLIRNFLNCSCVSSIVRLLLQLFVHFFNCSFTSSHGLTSSVDSNNLDAYCYQTIVIVLILNNTLNANF